MSWEFIEMILMHIKERYPEMESYDVHQEVGCQQLVPAPDDKWIALAPDGTTLVNIVLRLQTPASVQRFQEARALREAENDALKAAKQTQPE